MLRAALLAAAAVAVGVLGPTATASASPSANVNPTTSLQPSAAFDTYCMDTPTFDVSRCDTAAIADIDRGRKLDGLPDIKIPASYARYTTVRQLVFLANRERTARGLPSLPGNTTLDKAAHAGARAGEDPTGPSGYTWGSNLAYGYQTPLAADFAWMYDDGPGGSNADCAAAGDTGCWGHRDNILAPWSGEQGAGTVTVDGEVRLTQLFVENY